MLSREVFAMIISLQQTGQLNDASIQSLSDSIGQKIEAEPIADIYTNKMQTIVGESKEAVQNYLTAFTILAIKYENEDIGSELTLVSQGIANNDPQALYAAKTVAEAYKSFGNDLIKIPVPPSIANINLSLANNYEKTAISIESLTRVLTDPIIGMRAIIGYKIYSHALVSDIDKLSSILQ